MTSEQFALLLSGGFGIFLSLLFSFAPGLSDWYYSEVGKKYRGLFMAGFGLGFSILVYASLCVWGLVIPGITITCGTTGILTIAIAFVTFMTTNQVTYLTSPPSPAKARVAVKP